MARDGYTRMDQLKADSAFRKYKKEKVLDRGSVTRKVDKNGESEETRKAYKVYDKIANKNSLASAKRKVKEKKK